MEPFFVAGKPIPKGSKNGNIKRNKFGQQFVVIYDQQKKGLKDWENTVRMAAISRWQGREMIQGAVRINLIFQIKRPKNQLTSKGKRTKYYRPFPTVKPDVDKLERAILDSLTGIVYKDDAQVVTGFHFKRYSELEGVWITISELKEDSENDQQSAGNE